MCWPTPNSVIATGNAGLSPKVQLDYTEVSFLHLWLYKIVLQWQWEELGSMTQPNSCPDLQLEDAGLYN